MNTITWTHETARGYAMSASACVVPSHAAMNIAAAVRGAVDVRTGLTTKPNFDAGHRTWRPPIT